MVQDQMADCCLSPRHKSRASLRLPQFDNCTLSQDTSNFTSEVLISYPVAQFPPFPCIGTLPDSRLSSSSPNRGNGQSRPHITKHRRACGLHVRACMNRMPVVGSGSPVRGYYSKGHVGDNVLNAGGGIVRFGTEGREFGRRGLLFVHDGAG